MTNNFFTYLQQLELLAFFSGYSLLYAVTIFIGGLGQLKNTFISKISLLLPLSYALTGTFYFAFQLKKLFPDYSIQHISLTVQIPWLMAWALLTLLFWIPSFRKRKVASLIHSLVFFSILVKDIFLQLSAPTADSSVVKNDMTVYCTSLLFNLGSLILIIFFTFLFRYKRQSYS